MNESIFHSPWRSLANEKCGSISECYIVHETKTMLGNLLDVQSSHPDSRASNIVKEIILHNADNIKSVSLLLIPTYNHSFPRVNLLSSKNQPNTVIESIQRILQPEIHEDFIEEELFHLRNLFTNYSNQSELKLTGNETLEELLAFPNVQLLSSSSVETANRIRSLFEHNSKNNLLVNSSSHRMHLPSLLALTPDLFAKLSFRLLVHISRKNQSVSCSATVVYQRFYDEIMDVLLFHNSGFRKLSLKRIVENEYNQRMEMIIPMVVNTPVVTVLLKTRTPIQRATVQEERRNLLLTFQESGYCSETQTYLYYLDTADILQTVDPSCVQLAGGFYLSSTKPITIEWKENQSEKEVKPFSVIYLLFDFLNCDELVGSPFTKLKLGLFSQSFTPVFNQKIADRLNQQQQPKLSIEEFSNLYFETLQQINWMEQPFSQWNSHFAFLSLEDNKLLLPISYSDYCLQFCELHHGTAVSYNDDDEGDFVGEEERRNTDAPVNSVNHQTFENDVSNLTWIFHFQHTTDTFLRYVYLHKDAVQWYIMFGITLMEYLNTKYMILPKEERVCSISLEPIEWFELFYKCNQCKSVYKSQCLLKWVLQQTPPNQLKTSQGVEEVIYGCPNCRLGYSKMMQLYCQGPLFFNKLSFLVITIYIATSILLYLFGL